MLPPPSERKGEQIPSYMSSSLRSSLNVVIVIGNLPRVWLLRRRPCEERQRSSSFQSSHLCKSHVSVSAPSLCNPQQIFPRRRTRRPVPVWLGLWLCQKARRKAYIWGCLAAPGSQYTVQSQSYSYNGRQGSIACHFGAQHPCPDYHRLRERHHRGVGEHCHGTPQSRSRGGRAGC